MKAILINAKARTVTEINMTKDYKEINQLLGSRCFTVACDLPNGDTVYVDDEGEYNPSDFFELSDGHQPFAGNGLVMGLDHDTGESQDCKTSTTDIHNDIMWYDVATLILKGRVG